MYIWTLGDLVPSNSFIKAYNILRNRDLICKLDLETHITTIAAPSGLGGG